jgi:actin-related protein 8
MPRGIPNAKRDDTGFRYTTFHVPLVYVHFITRSYPRLIHLFLRPNPKHVSSTYLKSETQTLWYRKNQAKGKGAETAEEGPSDGRYVSCLDLEL